MRIILQKGIFLVGVLLLSHLVQSQDITGKVSDATGPLPGANVVVKGTTNGTQTDFDGNYVLNNVNSEAILIFSYIGYQTLEVAVDNRSVIDITLEQDAQALDEVFVVGYGTIKKQDQTTSVVSVSSEDFNRGVISSPEELIQGKAPGVVVTQTNGEPGAGLTVRVRGGKSITASNDPLYIIDGVPIDNTSAVPLPGTGAAGTNQSTGNPLAFLNPNDIASINVLKDAAAAAIYGSRGANGVILITTKRGQSGAAKLSLDYNTSVGWVRNRYDIYTAEEIRNLDVEAAITDSGADTDWQDEVYQTAIAQNLNLAMSGGGEGNAYRASLSYANNEGVLQNSGLERITGRYNVNQSLFDGRLELSSNITASRINRSFAPNEQLGGFLGGVLSGLFNYSPTQPVRNEDGTFSNNGTFANPVKLYEDVSDKSVETRILGNISANLKLFPNLTGTVNIGVDHNTGERRNFLARDSQFRPEGFASRITNTRQSKLIESYLTYDKYFGLESRNNLQVVGGYSFQQFDSEGFGASAQDLTLDSFGFNSFASDSDAINPTAFRDRSKLVSFYGRAQYNHDSRYILSAVFRADGSTRFGEDNKWAYFPGVSAAWRIINEKFMDNQSTFSDLKLRASYGSIGNQAIEPYQSLATLASVGQVNFGDNVSQAFFFNNFANPDLKWETTTTTNIGIDWGFLDNRLSGTFEYYISDTDDLLLQIPLPAPADPNVTLANVGSVRNSGFEGSINYRAFDKRDFTWDVGFIFATLKNEVTSLDSSDFSRSEIAYGVTSGEGAGVDNIFRIQVGQPVNAFFGAVFDGLVDGIETYEDLNGDGVINADDRRFIGDAQPDFTYSINSNLRYKNWDLNLFFRGVSGIDIYNNTAQTFGLPTRIGSRNVIRGFIEEGESTTAASRRFSTRFLEDGSFFRLDNFTIGYTLPDGILGFTDSVRFTLSGQNVFVITDYSGQDPEVSAIASSQSIQTQGIDYLTFPRPTTYSIGVNINF